MSRLRNQGDYCTQRQTFRWEIPSDFNIYKATVGHPEHAHRRALRHIDTDGKKTDYTFSECDLAARKLAQYFDSIGLPQGARVGIFLSQCPETIITHMACYLSRRIAMPLFCLFRHEALHYRLENAEAQCIVCDKEGLEIIRQLKPSLPSLKHVLCVDDDATSVDLFSDVIRPFDGDRTCDPSGPDDPAVMIYTSGTTGAPKGALHGHRVLLGHMPCVDMTFECPTPDDNLFWTPADWSWIGGLFDVLMPSLLVGSGIVSYRFKKFDPLLAFDLMAQESVRNVFLPPTALKLMRSAHPKGRRQDISLRTAMSGGEALSGELLDWGREVLGVSINELYGQTECNLVLGNSGLLFPQKQGSIGKPVPGHDVVLLDDHGEIIEADYQTGQIAVAAPDPVMMLGYWNNEVATAEKYHGDYLLTGDFGYRDEEGYYFFDGRRDDLISVAGYRIGPTEIEDCIVSHPDVAMVAVIGVPDEVKGQVIKAFVVPRGGRQPDFEFVEELKGQVRNRLAAHEVPKFIEFVDALPLTATGKIIRAELRNRL